MIPQIIRLNFPSYATLSQAIVTHNDMGDRVISTQVKIDGSIVPDFSYDWEVEFKGAKYIHPLREPQASKDNTSIRSTIDLTFQHWAIYQLKRHYFVQLATTESGTAVVDKYNASLGVSLPDFCVELQRVLDFYFPDKFVIDLKDNPEYDEEAKFISINYSYIWEVLQKVYETYNVRWDIQPLDIENDRYTIRIGYEAEDINHVFEYGFDGGLLKVERQVQNSDIRNKLLGRGGSKNLPYLYFKDFDKYGETEDNGNFIPDPDAIPELKNIYFSELRCSNFRNYVQGWKTNPNRDLSYGDVVEEYDETRAINDFAYKAGHEDLKFDPIEYVKDDESIAKYGVLEGALENNEEVYPSIQGAMTEYGRADEVVDVEEVTTDYGEVEEAKLLQTDVEVTHNSRTAIQGGVAKTISIKHRTDVFEIPDGYMGYFANNPSIISRADFHAKLYRYNSNVGFKYYGIGSGSRSLTNNSKVTTLKIYNADTNSLIDSSTTASLSNGRYYAEYEGQIYYDGKVKIDGFEEYDQYRRYELTSCYVDYTFSLNLICNVLEGANLLDIDTNTGLIKQYSFTIGANDTAEHTIDTDISFKVPASGANIFSTSVSFIQNAEWTEAHWVTKLTYKDESGATIVTDNSLNIEEGEYNLRVVLTIKNLNSSSTTFKVQLNPVTLYYNVVTEMWQPTFNIWLKNIWSDTQEPGEEDDAYAQRVWSPILGQVEGETAKVAFTSGLLSQSSDWDFKIVGMPVVDRTKSITTTNLNGDEMIVSSEWRITLAKSDAELESMNKYIPYKDYNATQGDKFILTGIQMPHEYVLWGEQNLTDSKQEALGESSNIKPTWLVQTDKVRLQQDVEGQKLIDQLGVGKGLTLQDKRWCANGEKLYIQAMTYNFSANLPEVEITLADKPSTQVSTIGRIQGDIDSLTTRVGLIGNVEQTIRAIGNKIFLRKDGVDDTSDSPTEFRRKVSSDNYRQGTVGGSGWALYRDSNGNAVVEADRIIARQDFQVNNLVANQIEAVGGKQILSAASITVSKVTSTYDSENDIIYYQCFFDQHRGTIANLFQVNDVAMGQTFSPDNEETKFYKMVVSGIGDNYIILTSQNANGEGIPQDGDVIVHYGNTTDESRQFVIVRDVIGGGYERMIQGLNSPSANGNEYHFAGYDTESGRARWFVGDSAQFIEYKNGHLQINADVTLGGGSDLSALEEFQQVKDTAQGAQDYIDNTLPEELEKLQNQIDGKKEEYYYEYDPTLENYPASEWTTEELKEEHLYDTFTNISTGDTWRWLLKDGTYQWVLQADTVAQDALLLAQEAMGVAQGKRTIFVSQPTPPYQVGDLWVKGTSGRTMYCVTERKTGNYTATDWAVADDSYEYTDKQLASYKDTVDSTVEDLNTAIATAEENAKDYTDSGKTALQESIDALEAAKANIEDVYTKAEADGQISQAESDAIAAAQQYADAAKQLAIETSNAYADGVVDTEEEARITQAEKNLADAKKYAEDMASNAESNAQGFTDEKVEEVRGEVAYLKTAFPSGTILNVNGVTLSSFVGVKGAQDNVVAGMYGGASPALNQQGYQENGDTIMVFAGMSSASDIKNAKTKIFASGKFMASEADIRGTITAISGQIGDYIIGESSVTDYSATAIESNNTQGRVSILPYFIEFAAKRLAIGDEGEEIYEEYGTLVKIGGQLGNGYTTSNQISITTNDVGDSMSAVSYNASIRIDCYNLSKYEAGDPSAERGNHAIMIDRGNVCGFRIQTRRLQYSQDLTLRKGSTTATVKNANLLSKYDGMVIPMESMTLVLPHDAEDGQIYYIKPYSGTTTVIVNPLYTHKIMSQREEDTTKALSSGAINIFIFDEENNRWHHGHLQ